MNIGCYKCPNYEIIYLYRKNQVGASWENIVANEIMNPNLVKQLLYRSGSLNVNCARNTKKMKIMQGGHTYKKCRKRAHLLYFIKLD